MELTRRVEETEDIDIVFNSEDVLKIFADAGYPIKPGTPIQIITGGHGRDYEISADLGQCGSYLILRKRRISIPIFERGEKVTSPTDG